MIKKPIITMRRRHIFTGMLFVLPWVMGFIFFTLTPMYDTLMMSFQRVRVTGLGLIWESVGFENYRIILTEDTGFIAALTNYLRETLLFIPLILIFSLIAAMLLNMPGRCRGLFRVIFFLPVVISSGPVLTMLATQGALHLPGNNTIIQMLTRSGVFPESVLGWITYLMQSFTLILWHSGLQILIFLAALQKQDPNLIEAAQIDGASRWVVFWRLTLVSLNPMIVINGIFTVVMLSVFDTNPIITKITGDMFNPVYGYGYASALTWLYFIILVIIIGLVVLITRRNQTK